MKTILCFGDSNTYGYNPFTKGRFDYNERWTGLLDKKFENTDYRVVEEGLCGRTTIYEDENRKGACGLDVLPVILETHSPVEYVVLMLGTNDCKYKFNSSEITSSQGIEKLIEVIHKSGTEKILVISPILLGDGVGDKDYDEDMNNHSVEICRKLKESYKKVALKNNCMFLAASDYAQPSQADREHLDVNGHKVLSDIIYKSLSEDINK